MIDVNYRTILYETAIALSLMMLVAFFVANTGCVSMAKTIGKDALSTPTPTPTPLPTPTPTPTPTPKQTPRAIETLAAHYVDPYMTGERWEGQWFKWLRYDVQGEKDLEIGILAYRHAYLDSYTWWNAALGNYQTQLPTDGNRYFVAWVHEEMLGVNSTYDPSMWIFDERAFRLQVKNNLYEVDTSHNPVNRIKELDTRYDYYNTVTAGPFGWDLRYTGHSPETAGYEAERRGWIRMGKGNAIDGYLLFEVPKSTMDEDVALIGSFSSFGSAYWKFSR